MSLGETETRVKQEGAEPNRGSAPPPAHSQALRSWRIAKSRAEAKPRMGFGGGGHGRERARVAREPRGRTSRPYVRGLSLPWPVGAPLLSLLWQQEKHEEARLKYLQAYAVLKYPGVTFNLARAEMTVGHTVEAYKLLREFLKLPQTDMDRSLLARKYHADLAKKVSFVTVSEKTPKGTKVMVDGAEAGEAPLADPIVVLPGKHEVLLRYGDQEKKEPVACGAAETVTVELAPKAVGAVTGPVTPPPPTTEYGNWVPTVVLGGVGVAGLAVGGVMGALSASHNDELKSLSTTTRCTPGSAECAKIEDEASSARGLGTVSIIGYVGGGLFLGAAIVTAVVMKPWQPREKSAAKVQLVPGFGGGAIVGTF